jgi:hypothetical protein
VLRENRKARFNRLYPPTWSHPFPQHVLVLIKLETHEIVHMGITASPTLAWVNQQVTEATAWDQCPRFLLHDNDGTFGQYGQSKAGFRCWLDAWLSEVMEITGVPIPKNIGLSETIATRCGTQHVWGQEVSHRRWGGFRIFVVGNC